MIGPGDYPGVVTAPPVHRRRSPSPLPEVAPRVLLPGGTPEWGCYRGIPTTIDYGRLASPHHRDRVQRFLKHKRWMYVFASTDALVVVAAIVDAGPTGTGFVMVTDRESGRIVADASRPGGLGPLASVNDRPTDGHRSHYALPGTLMTIRGEGTALRLRATLQALPFLPGLSDPWIDLDLSLESVVDGGITAVSEIRQSRPMVTTTVKNAALATSGQLTLRADGVQREFDLSDGWGGFDYTSGYLPRHTAWRWAFGTYALPDGRTLGFNLVSGFTGIGDDAVENVVWIDGHPHPLDSRARIDFQDGDPASPWRVTTADGAVDLVFEPLAIHRERVNLGAVRSSFLQPTGHFRGTITAAGRRIAVERLPGVVEDQDVVW